MTKVVPNVKKANAAPHYLAKRYGCLSQRDTAMKREIYANLVFKDMIKRRPDRLSSPPLFSLLSLRSHL